MIRTLCGLPVSLVFFCAVCAAAAEAPSGQTVTASTDKTSYSLKETIKISLKNSGAESVYSVAASATPAFAIINFEKNKNQWVWDALPLHCNRLECDTPHDLPVEIQAGSTRTFSWQPRVYSKRGYLDPEPGLYRLTLMYQTRKGSEEKEWTWRTVKSNAFTLHQGGR
ncbi:MAG TPA: hypothetical protein P5110_09740 [Candidatus Omnitrophota bacterium]|nr:hypothetical protein [Candidatus Omnitrophota bacterium]HRZ15776.1 hypothetical protein [Candidatus Omnitrophota bacterium]